MNMNLHCCITSRSQFDFHFKNWLSKKDKLDALGNLLPIIGHYFLFIRVNTSDIHFMSLGKNDDNYQIHRTHCYYSVCLHQKLLFLSRNFWPASLVRTIIIREIFDRKMHHLTLSFDWELLLELKHCAVEQRANWKPSALPPPPSALFSYYV